MSSLYNSIRFGWLYCIVDDVEYLDEEGVLEPVEIVCGKTAATTIDDTGFVESLENCGRVLLHKAQTPAMRKKKQAAIEAMMADLRARFGVDYTQQQVKKKVDNLKTRLKSKVDAKKTGNLRITLSKADKMLMDLLDAADNPSISQLKS